MEKLNKIEERLNRLVNCMGEYARADRMGDTETLEKIDAEKVSLLKDFKSLKSDLIKRENKVKKIIHSDEDCTEIWRSLQDIFFENEKTFQYSSRK